MSIPNYKTLYNYSSTGKIYQWSIKITKNKDNTYKITTLHGQKDGKKVEHSREIKKGKVKRSVLEQATLEADSKWKKKHNKDGYRSSVDDFDSQTNSKIDSKSKKVIRPMLASKFTFESLTKKSSAKNIVLPCYVQRKFDGIRCLTHLNEKGNVVMETRTGTLIENFDNMRIELKKVLLKMPKRFYLDGELFTLKIPFENLNGLVRKKANKTTPVEIGMINKIDYMIFDCFDINNLDLTFENRYKIIQDIFKSKFKYLYKAQIYKTTTSDEIKKYHQQFMKEGHEGTILRNIEAPYEIKKRSKHLQKYKDMKDEEFRIIGFSDGNGSDKGCVIWKCITKEGKDFTVVPNGTKEFRKNLFKNGEKYIGKQLTVVFQDYSEKDKIPRFPRGKTIRNKT
tara:strand:+ start:729 stop:1916 length:1188 start_codon:yes stop_codon:yes gene_type:complete